MPERERERFLAWAQTRLHQQRVRRAQQVVHDAVQRHRNIYVAFSGGKDSTALLHLVMQVAPDAPVVFFDHGRNLVPIQHVCEAQRIAKQCGCERLRVITRPQRVQDGVYVSDDNSAQWMFRRIAKLGYDAVIVGVRAEESIARRQRGQLYNMLGQVCIAPLYEWQARDVWAYIVNHDLPYLSHYDRMRQRLGMDYEQIRYGTPFGSRRDGLADNRAIHQVAYWEQFFGDI